MQFTVKTGLDRLPLNILRQRLNSLMLERKATRLRLKATKRKLAKRRLKAKLKTLNFRIARLTKEINSRPKTVRQGGVSRPVSPVPAQVASQFAPSASSSFQPSVTIIKPPVPVPVPLPTFVRPSMPSFVAEDPTLQKLDVTEEELIMEEPVMEESTGFDLMTFVEDNKFLIGGAVLAGLFFAFRPKAKKRSNPKRKSRKRKAVRKVRRNKRRSGYHRQ
jgi:hypothetical protein